MLVLKGFDKYQTVTNVTKIGLIHR